MKKALVLILCLAMLMGLAAGCSPSATTGGTTGATTTAAATTEKPGPPKKIVAVYIAAGASKDQQLVNDEMNKYILPLINVEVELMAIDTANYEQQCNLMITSRETMDLLQMMQRPAVSFATMTSQNMLMDITELAPKYAQGIFDEINRVNPAYINGTKIDGRLYAFTSLFDKASSQWLAFRKDILDKNNLKLNTVKNVTDLEAMLDVIKANEKDIAPWFDPMVVSYATLVNFDDFSKPYKMDNLGDTSFRYGVLIGQDDKTAITNFFATDYYKSWLQIARRWYQKGLIYKDYPTTTDRTDALVSAGKVAGMYTAGEADYYVNVNIRTNREIEVLNIGSGLVTTGMIQKFGWAVPTHSKEPEAALKFLNLMYTDDYVVNLIDYGIEGKHYVVNADKTLSYPEGVDSKTVAYKTYGTYVFGSQFRAKVFKPGAADLRDKALAINKNAVNSVLMGFTVNGTPFKDELTAVTNVLAQYRKTLDCGSVDPDKVLPEFLAALEAAGMSKIIAEVQRQINIFKSK
jgi:putative aldouronate transport system substrate-binding protein